MKCKCGCGKDIVPKPWHKYYKHDFFPTHNGALAIQTRIITCDYCGKQFKHFYNKNRVFKHTYCSRKCASLGRRNSTQLSCSYCQKSFLRPPSLMKGNKRFYCSIKCRSAYRKKFKTMSGPKHPNWKGGKQTNNAYISVYNPNHPSNSKGYVLEHRLVLEKELGRYLTAKERVHHINHIKNDNHKENLILFKNGIAHYYFHKNGRYVPEEVVFDGRYKAI